MSIEVYLLIIIVVLLFFALFYRRLYLRYKVQFQDKAFDYQSLYVKHGKHWENFVPFMKDFPGSKENFRFIGNPIDGIIFDDDEIKFVEIKTGKSQLNDKQKRVRNLVENKRVGWKELRY